MKYVLRKWHVQFICLLLASWLQQSDCIAVEKVFVGAGWSDFGAWSPVGIPGTGDVVVFAAGSPDCTIDIAASIMGLRIDSGYAGIIRSTKSLTIGTAGFIQYDGTFTGNFGGNSDPIDINGPCIITAGFHATTDGLTYFGDDFHYLANSAFVCNGDVIFDGATTASFTYRDGGFPPLFRDVTLDKANTFPLQIAATKKFTVGGNLTLTDGSIQSLSRDAEVHAKKDVYVGPNYDVAANTTIRLIGPDNTTYTQDKNGRVFNKFYLEKETVGDTVIFRSNNTTFVIGDLTDSMWIVNATLTLKDNAIHDFNFRYIELGILGGRLNANPFATIRMSGDLYCPLADPLLTFKNFGGTLEIDGASSNYIEINGTFDLYNFTVNKANTFPFTLKGSSILRVSNMASFLDGSYKNGPKNFPAMENRIEAEKDVTVGPNYDLGNGNVHFTNYGNGTFFHFRSGRTLERTVINKANPADTVFMIVGSATHGAIQDTVDIREGILYWPTGQDVNYDIGETYVESGATLLASTNKVRASGNFNFTGGLFAHSNGTFEIDGSGTSFSAAYTPEFYNLILLKNNTFAWTLPPGQVINVINSASFMDGKYNGNSSTFIDLYNDATVGPNYDVGTGRIRFRGSSNANFFHEKNGQTFRKIYVDKAGGILSYSRSSGGITAGINGDTLEIENGQVQFPIASNNLDYSEIIINSNGTLTAPAGTANVSGNFRNSGNFVHNSGTWIWDGGTSRTYESPVPTDFWNFVLHKANTFPFYITAGQIANVRGTATFNDGSLRSNNYTGIVHAYGDVAVNSNYDPGNGRLQLVGNQNSNYQYTKTGRHFYVFDLQKTGGATVTVTASSTPTMGIASDTLRIFSGQLQFVTPTGDINLDYDRIDIETAGVLTASAGTSFCQSHFNNNGTFEHNSGTWKWDGATVKTYTSESPTDFWNWTLAKSNTFPLHVAAGDTANILNLAVFNDGKLHSNNYTGIVNAYNDVTVTTNFDEGNGRLILKGGDTCTYNYEKPNRHFYVFDVQKNTGAVVQVTRSGGTPVMGVFADTLKINSGAVEFLTADADLNYGMLFIEENGILNGASGTTFCQSNFHHLGGEFQHSNGNWSWDGATNTSFNSAFKLNFNSSTLVKNNTFTLTIDAADTLWTSGLLSLNDGRLIGQAEVTSNVSVGPNADGLTGELLFAGADTQFVSGNLDLINGNYAIDKDAGEVVLNSIMQINAAGQQIALREGILRTSASNYLYFTDLGNWTGGSNLSYVAGPVRKYGISSFTFPVGDGNRYAPARMEALTNFNTMQVEFLAENPNPLYPLSATGPLVDHVNSTQYWNVERLGGISPIRLLLDSVAAWNAGVDDPSSLVLVRWETDSLYWDDEGFGGYENSFVALSGSPGTLDGYGAVTFASSNGNNPLDGISPVCLLPQNLNAIAGPLSASLSWDDVSDAIGYQFEGENLGGPGGITTTLPGNVLNANKLYPCNPYRFRVQAACADTLSPISDWREFSTTGCDSCGIPDSVRVENLTATSATLAWNPVPSVIAYGILGGPSGGGTAFLPSNNISKNVGGLSPGTNYQFQVAAWCGADTSDFSALVFFTTPTSAKMAENTDDIWLISVFPNPASDNLYVQGQPFEKNQQWRVELFNGAGRLIAAEMSQLHETLHFDTSALPAGVYTLQYSSGDTVKATRITIQHN